MSVSARRLTGSLFVGKSASEDRGMVMNHGDLIGLDLCDWERGLI